MKSLRNKLYTKQKKNPKKANKPVPKKVPSLASTRKSYRLSFVKVVPVPCNEDDPLVVFDEEKHQPTSLP